LELEEAIKLTFETRETIISENHSVFQDQFYKYQDKLAQWKAFKNKTKIINNLELDTVLQLIKKELEPIYKRIKKSYKNE
jgi:hypothetical protein